MTTAISILGSGSGVGKSLIATGLCRLLTDAGINISPFKAQNMANQAGVTLTGMEMPRAQIIQAAACRKEPNVDMGPVLLKPVSTIGSQTIVLGKAIGYRNAKDYFQDTTELSNIALAALERLCLTCDAIIMEGAGSPVELNLWNRDYVNLKPARHLNASLILVVDIDKGGVFAQAKGTLDLLPESDRDRVIGIIVNKFKGDQRLFENGITILENICRVPVLAVISNYEHNLDEEDQSVNLLINQKIKNNKLNIGIVLTPRVSNTDDFIPLLYESDVQVTWITNPDLIKEQDLIILPGTKSSITDLVHNTASGITDAVLKASSCGVWVFGICGGYQMLGQNLIDEFLIDGNMKQWPGLQLLPTTTSFNLEKITKKNNIVSVWPNYGHYLNGYEIHNGYTKLLCNQGEPIFQNANAELGWRHNKVLGTYLHGILACNTWRNALLNVIREDRGLPMQPICEAELLDARITRWANHIKEQLRPGAWEKILSAAKIS